MKNLVLLLVFIAIALGILVWVFQLKSIEHSLAAEVSQLEHKHMSLIDIMAETENLNRTIGGQLQTEREQLARIAKACFLSDTTSEFPVQRGDFVVSSFKSRDSDFDYSFFVPKGEHVLRLKLRGYLYGSKVPGGPSSWFEKIEQLEFPLVPNEVGRFEFRMVKEQGVAIAKMNLVGRDESVIDERQVKLGKRSLSGVFRREAGGWNIRLPGQIDKILRQTYSFNTLILSMVPTINETQCLEATVSIHSPNSKVFLRDKDVGGWLKKGSNSRLPFNKQFHREEKSGLLVPFDAEKSNFSR